MGYVLHSSSIEAEAVNRLHVYFYVAASFVLFIVIAATVFIVTKFKRKKSPEYTPVTLSSRLEYFLVGIPIVLVMVFFFLMLNTMHQVQPSAEGKTPDVVITGHQFWWEAQYPGQQVTAANEIHLPVGRRLLIKLLTADVIHDWWIPEFGSKMDMISGQDNYLWVTIKTPGVYHGACSEFCGAEHAGMNIIVVAQQQNDFNSWLQQHRQSAAPITDALVQTGALLIGPPAVDKQPDLSLINTNPQPDWYLLWIFALFALIPPAIESYAMFFGPMLIFVLLFSIPFISNKVERSPLRRPWAMAGVAAVVVIVGALLVAGSKAGWSPDFNTKMLPASVVRSGDTSVISGSVLFYQKGCLYCRQIGRYGGVKGPALTYVSRRLSAQEIQIRVINGGVNRPAYGQSLSGDELNRTMAFLKTRQ